MPAKTMAALSLPALIAELKARPSLADEPDVFYLSTTAYGEFSACMMRGNFHQNLRLVPKPRNLKTPMRNGIWIHSGVEQYHAHGDWGSALDGLVVNAVELGIEDAKIEEHRKKTERVLMGYMNHYWGKDKWKVLATELHVEWDTGTTIRIWEGGAWAKKRLVVGCTLDLLVDDPVYGVVIVEHKSTIEIPPPSWRVVDPQTAIQALVCERVGIPVAGLIFNYLLTKDPSVPRFTKKDGTLYANSADFTTSKAWDKGIEDAKEEHGGKFMEGGETWRQYVDRERENHVNDDAFYQRHPILKPKGYLAEALRDLAITCKGISDASKSGHWRRSYHTISCRRFCTYSDLCMAEYQRGGRPATVLREADFILDDGTREGDTAWAKYGRLLMETED